MTRLNYRYIKKLLLLNSFVSFSCTVYFKVTRTPSQAVTHLHLTTDGASCKELKSRYKHFYLNAGKSVELNKSSMGL